ncbi:hypothetical protein ACLB2K_011889 [Fragaria x ananassa]
MPASLSILTALSSAATFNCTTPTNATPNCHTLIDFVPTNATTFNIVKTLFNITRPPPHPPPPPSLRPTTGDVEQMAIEIEEQIDRNKSKPGLDLAFGV